MDGDKIISLADAKACLDSGSLGLDLKENLSSDLVEAFFAKADSDSSGGLDEDELASAFQQYKTEQLVSTQTDEFSESSTAVVPVARFGQLHSASRASLEP
ncbi:unnamed protein product [Polarella glacialis]|uniref:EF-hand domain-containing protein n=1 Tax=Polarella glacialis TaxID=89957 RepID=A0A813G2Z2_POLGL|nr:unnamed protein product [Polarella glacialis]CAE8620479.1 unnamed protein product [Polarella glacialis]CAE8695520.1 unnamed protein product [Polarella glacialis]